METAAGVNMPKRGPHPKNGVKSPVWLFQAMLILVYFERERNSGEKYAASLHETTASLERDFPSLHGARSTIKRVSRAFRPKNVAGVIVPDLAIIGEDELSAFQKRLYEAHLTVLKFRGSEKKNPVIGPHLPPVKNFAGLKVISIKLGLNPEYRRHNAKQLKPRTTPQ